VLLRPKQARQAATRFDGLARNEDAGSQIAALLGK